jgi:hypothetical protein
MVGTLAHLFLCWRAKTRRALPWPRADRKEDNENGIGEPDKNSVPFRCFDRAFRWERLCARLRGASPPPLPHKSRKSRLPIRSTSPATRACRVAKTPRAHWVSPPSHRSESIPLCQRRGRCARSPSAPRRRRFARLQVKSFLLVSKDAYKA